MPPKGSCGPGYAASRAGRPGRQSISAHLSSALRRAGPASRCQRLSRTYPEAHPGIPKKAAASSRPAGIRSRPHVNGEREISRRMILSARGEPWRLSRTRRARICHAEGKMAPFYFVLWGLAAVFGATAIAALVWSIRRGEFDNLREAALSIFDEEEPPGAVTDRFPGSCSGTEPLP